MNNSRGSAAFDVLIMSAVIVFVIFPVFSAVMEKYAVMNRIQTIKDAVDITNISAYVAIDAEGLGKSTVTINNEKVYSIYKSLLRKNLKLDNELYPLEGSIAEGRVVIDSLIVYTEGFPLTCPDGVRINRPAVHSVIEVPIRPVLYRSMMLKLSGKEYIDLRIHVDSEIPVDN
jgi:hypothetical protein